MENGQYVPGSIWFYAPDKGAPVFFAFTFAISMLIHGYQCIRYKSWKVTGIFVFAALVFTAGYILREIAAFNFGNLDVLISSVVMVYAAPPLYELANYFILSRILYYVPYNSPIHPGRVFTTFAAISSIVEALNGNGASYTVNQSLPDSKRAIGRALLKSALCIQLGVLGSFVLLAAYFHRKCKKSGLLPSNLRAVLITLYCSSALIASRTIYRTIEYFTTANVRYTAGLDPSTLSPLIRYEWFFYVFEASLMLANTFLLNARHPMRFLPRDNRIYLAEDGTTEIQGPGYEDKRPFIVTVFDPFDLVGMCQGRNMQKKFWETHEEGRLETTDVAKSEKDKATRIEGVVV